MSRDMQKVGAYGADSYEILGIDWKEKKLGVPVWGWAAALAGAGYWFFFRKKR